MSKSKPDKEDLKKRMNENKSNNKPAKKKPDTMMTMLDRMKPEIERALPKHIDMERFTRIALTAVRTNDALKKAKPVSFIAALMNAAQLGLEPNTPLGECYIIPRKRKGAWEAQFQLGYKGLVNLAWQSGLVSELEFDKVCENDEFEYAKGADGVFYHKPNLNGDRGNCFAYYAYIKTKSGGFISVVMSKAEVKAHAKEHSDSYKSKYSPWKNHFDMMAYKTCLKRLIDKKAPKSSDRNLLKTAITADNRKSEFNPDTGEVEYENEFKDFEEVDGEAENE